MKKRLKKLTVVVERDEDGWIMAKVPAIPGCYTQGKSVAQALSRITEAIELSLEEDSEVPKR